MADRLYELTPVMVDQMPEKLEPGKLYICLKYSCAAHLCACGCGREAHTEIKQGDVAWKGGWDLTLQDGKATLRPSIGNFKGDKPSWHAHYHITQNKIEW